MKKHLLHCLIFLFLSCFPFTAMAFENKLLDELETRPLNLMNLDTYKRELTISFAQTMQDKKFQDILRNQILKHNGRVSIHKIFNKYSLISKKRKLFKRSISLLDRRIREAKGIALYANELLEVRLASSDKSDLDRFYDGEKTLFTYVPSGDEKDWKYIEAFDSQGAIYYLDPFQKPDQPVIVLGINGQQDLKAGLQMVNKSLREAGLQITTSERKGFIETTKLDYIRLKDTKEPWISGSAEIFAIINGVQPSQIEAQLSVVEMPYIEYAEQDHFPNQIVIFWDQYQYAAVNINFFEKDDNYNYQELIDNLLSATASIMIMFPESAPYAGLVTLANGVVQAMPDEWFTNNDDYVDVYYTIEKGKTYTKHGGASGNATITLSPYNLLEN
ncbi:MAG: DUF3103 family protein [Desulfobacteraceae bacterium]|nr:DUF3103 family protein [Desulfobacteraceae bacterium]